MNKKVNNKVLSGLLVVFVVFSLFLFAMAFLPQGMVPFSVASEDGLPNEAPPRPDPDGDSGDFDEDACSSQGDPEGFYNVGAYTAYDLTNDIPAALIAYGIGYNGRGRVLGYEIVQANDPVNTNTFTENQNATPAGEPCGLEDPCGCFCGGDFFQECSPGGCTVYVAAPELETNITDWVPFNIEILPWNTATEVYVAAYVEEQFLGYLDCDENNDDTWFTQASDGHWYSTCNVSQTIDGNTLNYSNIHFKVLANLCYWAIPLTNDPVNNPNYGCVPPDADGCDAGADNPLFGPYNPFIINEPCTPDWSQCEWTECLDDGHKYCNYFDSNNCNIDYNKPAPLSQLCSIPDANTNTATNTNTSTNINTEPDVNVNTNTSTNQNVNSDSTGAISPPTITYPEHNVDTRDTQPTIRGTAEVGHTVEIYLDNEYIGETMVASDGTFSFFVSTPLDTGSHDLFSYTVASDGRTSIESDHVVFNLLEPLVNMLIPEKGTTLFSTTTLTAVVEGEIENLDFMLDSVDSNSTATSNVLIGVGRSLEPPRNNIWERSWDVISTPAGRYYVYARVKDRIGKYYTSNRVETNIDHSGVPKIDEQIIVDDELPKDEDADLLDSETEESLGYNPNKPEDFASSDDVIARVDELVKNGQLSLAKAEEIKSKVKKIVFEEPKTSGQERAEELGILEIKNVAERVGENKLVFSGIGPPNTYISLFIYSTPIVVTTKTDASGNFVYILDKNLVDGKHEAYVTITDNTGKIQDKSSPYTFFIRRAQAVSEEEYLRGDVDVDKKRAGIVNSYLGWALGLVAVSLLLLLTAFIISKRKQKGA